MSLWNLEFEGFPPQWLDIADRFEGGEKRIYLPAADERAAIALRFEWYAFKRRLRKLEMERERMYPTLPRVKAEIAPTPNGQWMLRLALRDIGKTAKALDAALAMTPEEMEELDKQFGV